MKQLIWITMLASTVLLAGCENHQKVDEQMTAERQAEVAERGSHVMPFDLDRSTHIFEKIDNGGRQQVMSDDGDEEQIELIRSHMIEIAGKFSEGNFHSPEMIHGEHMPGLHDLVMGYEKLSIVYSEIEKGGQILYTTEDSDMVTAIHTWFEAQVSDHGEHAHH